MNLRIGALILILALTVSACATSRIAETHHLFANPAEAYATVVVFRPIPQRTRGIGDNDVTVEIDKKVAVELSAGEYVVLRIKPTDAVVTLKNMAYVTWKVVPEEVSRSRKFSFEANQTYYIQTRLKVEEWRGLYFEPREADEATARKIISGLKPVNQPLS